MPAEVGLDRFAVAAPRTGARGVTAVPLAWFREQSGRSLELHATAQAGSLYRFPGFTPGPNPGPRIRL